jgi:D-aminopeptidase
MSVLTNLDQALSRLASTYPGAGGAVAVVKQGEVLARHAWGYADLERRLAFTPQTLFRICSISKQFTCALMLDQHPDPTVLNDAIRARMPLLDGVAPTALHLAHNQSGLRDYWATTMLAGSPVEAPFDEAQARHLIGLTRSLHFAPGTRYSYCNHNFRLLGDVVAERAGQDLATLLRTRVFDRAGMPTALLCADTSVMPDGTVGYEGSLEAGFRPAVNKVIWTGDAGIGASLDDMIAWERFIDATRDDPASLYQRQAAPNRFSDGSPAQYAFGLGKVEMLGIKGSGHGGGLRGWRSVRFYLPSERISVVALFNHMADPRAAALDLLATLVPTPAKSGPGGAAGSFQGAFQEPETGLVVRVEPTQDHRVRLYYSGLAPDLLDLGRDDEARAGTTALRRTPEGLWMDRGGENQSSRLTPITGEASQDVAGVFHSDEYEADFTCTSEHGGVYGAFSGFLGDGFMTPMVPVGPDLWRLPMPRALDHSPPGDWTIQFARDAAGVVVSAEIGCWLARRVMFRRR